MTETVVITNEALTLNGSLARKFLFPDGLADYISSDAVGIRLHREDDPDPTFGGVFVFDPPVTLANAQTFVGDTVNSSGAVTRNGAPLGTYNSTSTILASGEVVDTLAGRFSTVRMQTTLTATVQGVTASETSTRWLAEGIGVVREVESSVGTLDLVSSNRLPIPVASLLPISRSAVVGAPVTVFATMINAGPSPAAGCGVALPAGAPGGLSLLYQTTNPATNEVIGTPDTPVSLAPGARQSFLLALAPSTPFAPLDLRVSFDCENGPPAGELVGVNTLLISASTTPVPDVIALAATLTGDGIVNIPGASGTGAFAVASVNVGASGAITATADTGGATLPVNLTLCETNPGTGQCLQPPGASVATAIASGATPTFAIFATGTGSVVPFSPAVNRVFVRFRDGGGVVRGATSVAVRTQ